jgi:hypothetical protein
MRFFKFLNEVNETSNDIMLLDNTPKQNLLLSKIQIPKLRAIAQFF